MNQTSRKWVLPALALLCALLLSGVLLHHVQALQTDVREKNALLEESRAAWEKTASEKEALQEELTGVQHQIREAELSLSEARDRADRLKEDIAALTAEMDSLKLVDDGENIQKKENNRNREKNGDYKRLYAKRSIQRAFSAYTEFDYL